MRKFDFIAILFIISITVLKFVHLDADPPPFMAVAEYGDPAQYAYNARNKVLFGELEIDEKWNLMWLTIIPHFFTYLSFSIFGVSYKSMNLVPLFFSFLILIICYLILKDTFNEKIALFGAVFFGTNFLFFLYSRIADRVPEMLFFALLSIYFWLKGLKGSKLSMFLSGFFLWFSYNSKPKIIYFIPIFFFAHFVELIRRKESLKEVFFKTLILFSGLILAILIWLPFIYLPHHEMYQRFGSYNQRLLFAGFPNFSKILFYWYSRALFSIHSTLSLFGILLTFILFYIVRNYFQRKDEISPLEVMSICWIGIGYSSHSILFWRALRYYLDFFFPMGFIFMGFIWRMLKSKGKVVSRKINIFELVIYFYISLFIFSHILRRLYTPRIYQNLPKYLLIDIILSLFFVLLILVSIKYATFLRRIPKPFFGFLAILVAIFTIYVSSKEIINYLRHPNFQFKTISEDFGKAFDGSSMAGVWAVSTSVNNKIKAYHCWPRLTNTDPEFLKKKNVKYAFLWDDIETPFYMRNFPNMKDAVLRARYHIYHSITEEPYNHRRKFWNLFEIGGKPAGGKNLFEAELWTGPFGFPRYEKNASNEFVLSSQKKFASYPILFSPPFGLKNGLNEIVVKMKIEKRMRERIPVCLMILERDDGKITKKRLVYSDEFEGDGFKSLNWKVEIQRDSQWRLKIYNYSHIDFFIDYIKINI